MFNDFSKVLFVPFGRSLLSKAILLKSLSFNALISTFIVLFAGFAPKLFISLYIPEITPKISFLGNHEDLFSIFIYCSMKFSNIFFIPLSVSAQSIRSSILY